MASYDIIIQTLEYTRKIMGRKSIIYADALLVYTKYLMFFKSTDQSELLKIILKTKYFSSVRKNEFFRPGIEF